MYGRANAPDSAWSRPYYVVFESFQNAIADRLLDERKRVTDTDESIHQELVQMVAQFDLRSWCSMFPRMIHNHDIGQFVQEDDLSTIGLEAMRRSQCVN